MPVSIIVRTKDRPVFLRRALRNVLDQSYREFEIIIVNDGGDPRGVDNTCSPFQAGANIRVVSHNPGLGRGAALRSGIEHSEQDLLAIHDDDDLWHPEFLERVIGHRAETKKALSSCVGAISYMRRRIERLHTNGEVETRREEDVPATLTPKGLINVARYLTYQEDFFPIQAVFERAAALPHSSLLSDMNLFEDRLLFSHILLDGDIAVLGEVLAVHSVRESPTSGMNDTSRPEIDFCFALLQNKLFRSGGSDAAAGLAVAPFAHEIRRAAAARRRSSPIAGLRALLKRWNG